MSVALKLLGTAIAFVAIENLIFNTGFYAKILNPDSSAGALEMHLWNEHKRVVRDRNQVLVIGDSRMGFFPRYADQIKPEVGYTFATISTPGSTPRAWYYMLRDVDPTARGYAAIVIGMNDYDDAETAEVHAERETDMHYLAPVLRWSDVIDFSSSYRSAALRARAALSVLLKGTVYKADFQDLLLHRKFRLEYSHQARRESSNWQYDYVGADDTVAGLRIDWGRKTVESPPAMTPGVKAEFEGDLFAPNWPTTGAREAYLKRWLGKIYERYRGSDTKLIFIRLPRGPYLRPEPPPYNPHSSVRELARNPEVILDNEHDFDFLEKPEIFKDPWHLNAPGCGDFSRALAHRVREMLGPPHAL